ncbi:hypothetical protein [Actinomadura nitritigenes]|uniref:hypothetical protein n=1 Tax=Actinomadura nitritigenes TaxID=134602 RepID=UPI003D92466D
MAEIKVSVKGGHQLKAAAHALASAATIAYTAWHGGHTPTDALGLALVAGYGSFTAFRLGSSRPANLPHSKGRRRG